MLNQKLSKLSGWGKYPIEECYQYRPDHEKLIRQVLSSNAHNSYISFGLGRSYGDAPLNHNNGVLITTELNKFIAFDDETGVLECEAGVTFEEIIQCFLPRGYFLPVTPGTKYITVGGAIANDIHGKNHHIDGCFSAHVLEFKLLIASGEIIRCSKNENTDIFWATVGGIGLTGIILSAHFKLFKVDSGYYDVSYEKANNLDKALELFEASDDQYQYSVAWIDCLAKGKSLGRSVLMRGNHATIQQLNQREPLILKQKNKLNVPFNLPSFALNQFSIQAFNTVYYAKNPSSAQKIVDFDSFFYPLDGIHNWNRLYGKKGFVQYQAVFPPAKSKEGLTKLLEQLSSTNRSSFLAVLKSSGNEGQGLLSFPKKGYTLALDIPIKDDSLFPFLRKLDELVLSYGGRVYLAKDSTLAPEHFKQMYPNLGEFQTIKQKVDPNHLFSSSMARRLKIVEE
jgi:decaprenylphospho-beta-D-ribofuranose 2-oxidase